MGKQSFKSQSYKSGLSVLSLLILLTSTFAMPASERKPLTVIDYYMLMPSRYLRPAVMETQEAREAAIYIKDVASGYLQIRLRTDEVYTSIALFKKPDGKDVIAIESRDCTRSCFGNLYLLQYENSQWVDVTGAMLPGMNESSVRARVESQYNMEGATSARFNPRLLYTLTKGATAIEVNEGGTGMLLGRLLWLGGKFEYEAINTKQAVDEASVLASSSNDAGDRIQIIGINPQLPAKLPLKGHLNIKIAYDLKSAASCFIWALPVTSRERLRDSFDKGSPLMKRGAGVTTTWFGFNNEVDLDQIKITMADDQKKELVTLYYNVNARWEGTLECPTFHVLCFPDATHPGSPLACMAYPSGLGPDHSPVYKWTLSAGVITSGQGARRITINPAGTDEKHITATVEAGDFPAKCNTTASHTVHTDGTRKTGNQ